MKTVKILYSISIIACLSIISFLFWDVLNHYIIYATWIVSIILWFWSTKTLEKHMKERAKQQQKEVINK